MLVLLDTLRTNLKTKKNALLSVALPESEPNSKTTLSNTNLLITELRKLFKLDNSEYLPNVLLVHIEDSLKSIIQQLEQFQEDAALSADNILPIIKALDELYAYCLQYGLITFKFDAKEKTQTIESMRNCVNSVLEEVDRLTKQTDEIKESLVSASSQGEKDIKQLLEEHQQSLATSKETGESQIQTAVSAIQAESEQKKQDLERFLGEANTTLEKINGLHTDISGTEQKTQELLNETTSSMQSTKAAEKQSIDTKASIDQQLQAAQNQNKQIDSNVQQANTNVAEIKAKNSSADEVLATVKQKQTDIQEFYEKLESYSQEMSDIKKKAGEAFAKLKVESTTTVDTCKEQTDEILNRNACLQIEIKELLAQAVSAGLFGVFKERQKFLAEGRTFWKWAVVISSLLVVGGILLVAWLLSEKPDIVFFVRLGVMVPLGFLMYFAAAQYKKERQAEEEYAFKSAISFSLEPYRDLLVRMRENDQLEADFVQKLMLDIFDNPVKRMYHTSGKEDSTDKDAASTIISLFGEMSDEKKKIIFDALKKTICG